MYSLKSVLEYVPISGTLPVSVFAERSKFLALGVLLLALRQEFPPSRGCTWLDSAAV